MTSTLRLSALIGLAWAGTAFAQEPGADSDHLFLTIRPRPAEETRAEELARRAERLDSAFRFICTGCSKAPDPWQGPNRAFDPLGVLATPPKRRD